MTRRDLLIGAGAAAAAGLMPGASGQASQPDAAIAQAAEATMLQIPENRPRLILESVELLTRDGEYLVRLRTKNGLETVTAPNGMRMADGWPIFTRRLAPFFTGRDAGEIESLMDEAYRHQSNYKLQGLTYWVCIAAIEAACLDLIGRATARPLAELFGAKADGRWISVYAASGNRGNSPEEEVQHLRSLAAESGASALKIRLGGRMSRNADSPPDRTVRLIPLVREAFPETVLYADANSSYDVPEAERIGRMLEEHGYAFFEEPVPFDDLWGTKEVADRLEIPVAGGEQEFSMHRFRWTIENRAVDLVQPDLHYFGGFIRCGRVARMAAAAQMTCTPHMSGSGMGFVDVLHFASIHPNSGPHQEFKGLGPIPLASTTSDLRPRDGRIQCPSGPGLDVSVDPEYVKSAVPVGG
ncbi:MAG: mandelate racemase/muconate lactonizing enzyme family protein [Fimbriimonadaceae bacterium]|nr:mandelate racemase/muconate lactonizing enzyme family protein [Fimbriimonadaceae bacterium]